ncbi:hypothetical protein QAD02_000654 [Eretmocerus hayati]|uniref:Uncharacterized protein n=1 Tax=Eretmocerus hayati TaxID=131215 RepID=A0ACC2NE12_9HYME|nr:hypothetical protein QAD02_000654 [Eretmocerus hayati]
MQLWPLLGRTYHEPDDVYPPFSIACHCGSGKPKSCKAFFQQFTAEYNELCKTGIRMGDKTFQIKIQCLIGDKPARSEALCIKGHESKHACERCDMVAIYFKRRQVYPLLKNSKPRTDRSLRLLEDPQHHHKDSPLLQLYPAIDMVYQVLLGFMHGQCIGNMKKLLCDYWTNPSLKYLTKAQIMQLSSRLTLLQFCIPAEFQRCTRSLDVLSKWKATEYRLFLLYIGPIVLKGTLPKHLYKHFMMFSVGCRILCSPNSCLKYLEHARTYLTAFVELPKKYYGLTSQIFNMHSTVHLADDVGNMKCDLSHLTAFPFENYLRFLRKKIKGGFNPLVQLCNRVAEEWAVEAKPVQLPKPVEILSPNKFPQKCDMVIEKVKYKDVTLSRKVPNNTTGEIVTIREMVLPGAESNLKKIQISGEILEVTRNVFDYPTVSSYLNIHQVRQTKLKKSCVLDDVELKFMRVNLRDIERDPNNLHVVPILHQILTVRYSFPPYEEEEDEDFFKGIFKSRAPAPDSWPSYQIARELGDTSTLKAAQQILKEYSAKEKKADEMDEKLEALENTSLDPHHIPSLTQPPLLFAQDKMEGSEISGSFLSSIENGVEPVHNSPTKLGESKCSVSKNSPNLSQIEDGNFEVSRVSSDVSVAQVLTPLDVLSSSERVDDCRQPEITISQSQPSISTTDTSKTNEDSSKIMPTSNSLSTSSNDLIEVTPIQMNQLATKKDIEATNNNAVIELQNLLKSRETASHGRSILLLDDLKALHNSSLPLQTIDEFNAFGEKLSGLALKQDLATYFGGMITSTKNGRNSIRDILKLFCRKVVIRDHYVALQVPGGSTKKAFIETSFGKFLCDNVRARLQLDGTLIRDSFSKVILGVRDWEGGRAESSLKSGEFQGED